MLQLIQKRAPFSFDLLAVNLDQGHPGFPANVLQNHFEKVGVSYEMLYEDTHSIVMDKIPQGKTFCSLCSRLRRGILYNAAVKHNCNKIALGKRCFCNLMQIFLIAGNVNSVSIE